MWVEEYACAGVGWGVKPKRMFEYRGGWGFSNGSFGAHVLYGWPPKEIETKERQ